MVPAADFLKLCQAGASPAPSRPGLPGRQPADDGGGRNPCPHLSPVGRRGKTPLYFAAGGVFLGVIAAADVLKPDSPAAVSRLGQLGLDVVMLTGDNEATAQAIAAKAGIRHVISDVLPTEKAGSIQALQAQGHKVVMVGDGINDAPALVTADVGIAIGAGTDIAVESADVVLLSGSLQDVAVAESLSRATLRNIRENLFGLSSITSWAFPLPPVCSIPLSDSS